MYTNIQTDDQKQETASLSHLRKGGNLGRLFLFY